MSYRRSEYDVTDEVNVTETDSVLSVVEDIFDDIDPGFDKSLLQQAFEDCDSLFEGTYRGYRPCDALYHDKQHTIDMALALSRLINGHDRTVRAEDRLGSHRAIISIITALFHDAGYIRHRNDSRHHNGAEYTLSHVSRSSRFLHRYFTEKGMQEEADISSQMVHYTGYEVAPEDIVLHGEKLHRAGHMLGTADLIAQMSDRCYLEKCRDRLYPEFVLGGLAVRRCADGEHTVIYSSAEDLMRKSSEFYETQVKKRLDQVFNSVYRFEEAHFGGENHYQDAIVSNQRKLNALSGETYGEGTLKRKPPENYGTQNFPGLDAYLQQYPDLRATVTLQH